MSKIRERESLLYEDGMANKRSFLLGRLDYMVSLKYYGYEFGVTQLILFSTLMHYV